MYLDDESELFEFEYNDAEKNIVFTSIKKPIKRVAGIAITDEIYDLETPYGYGGPISNCMDDIFLEKAFLAYRAHCQKENIVCEFMRIHPFNTLSNRSNMFDFNACDRQVVIVDLSLSTEERRKKYSKTTRNILRNIQNELVIDHSEANTESFCTLYAQTMRNNNAEAFYYFSKKYFKQLLNINNIELLQIKKNTNILSSGFFMHGKDIAHYHLSANNEAFKNEHANYLLLDAAFDIAKNKGCRWMLIGGGRTTLSDDSLLAFKAKFSDTQLPFHIAGLTFLPTIKDKLNAMWLRENSAHEITRFQQYRV